MATFENIKKRANEIKNAVEPESVTAEDVGMLIGDLAENAEQTKDVLKETTEDVDYGRRRTDNLQKTLANIGAKGGTVQYAGSVALAVGTGLEASDAQQAFAELATEVFPLTVTIGANNAGSYEVGSEISPSIEIVATRRGSAVTITANDVSVSPTGIYNASTGLVTDTAFTPPVSGSKTYIIDVTQGGQTREVRAEYLYRHYLYNGVIDTKPQNAAAVKALIEGSWRSTNKVLSNDKTLGKTSLAANKYYLFAVKQTSQGTPVTLIVKNANSGGTINVPSSDKGSDLQITRVNNSGSDYYSWVIVPASSITWYFQITNS